MGSKSESLNTRLYPEMRLFDNPAEAKRVSKQCSLRLLKRPILWFSWIALMAAVVPITFVLRPMMIKIGLPFMANPGLLGGIVGGAFGGGFQFFWRKPMQKALRRELNKRGKPICLPCGYDLRAQTVPRCPECGAPFDPALLNDDEPQESA